MTKKHRLYAACKYFSYYSTVKLPTLFLNLGMILFFFVSVGLFLFS